MAAVDKLLKALVDRGMEALLLEPGGRPRMRLNGAEHDVSSSVLAGPTIEGLLAQVAPEGVIADSPAPESSDFDYALGDHRFRFSCMRTDDGWSALVVDATVAPEELLELDGTGDVDADARDSAVPEVESEARREDSSRIAGIDSVEVRPGEKLITSVAQLLQLMLDRGASDLHLSSHQQVRLRVDGVLSPLDSFAPPLPEWLEQLLGDILPDRNREEYERRGDTDFAYALDEMARFRVNVFRDRLGVGAVFRVIPNVVATFDELKLPAALRSVADLRQGLVLVTGPTGSGKSTTLAALVDLINRERNDHIITIEDPIEFVHESKGCLVHQREVGIHTGSFSRALKAALREDPDVVLVGELQDLETAAIALETAESGHLVFGTLHTTTAVSTIDRLINQFPADRRAQIRLMLAESLHAVIAQTLVKKKDGGRIAAHEMLVNGEAVSALIRDGETGALAALLESGGAEGMGTLNQALVRLVEEGLVEPVDAWIESRDKPDLVERLAAVGHSLDSV